MTDEILQFHINNDYVIKLTKLSDGIRLELPNNYLLSPNLSSRSIDYILTTEGFTKDDELVECPIYACRILITIELLILCREYRIGPNLVITYSNGNPILVNDLSILPEPQLDDDKEKEEVLLSIFGDFLSGEDSSAELAEEFDVLDGYTLMLDRLSFLKGLD